MADSPERKKRKRDVKEGDLVETEARITYHTPFKTFERLFNEASLDDTKRVVRAKLGLEPSVNVELAQLRGASRIVLEDEDDFHAFCVTLRANPQVDVQVTLTDISHSTTTEDTEITAPVTKKRKTKQSIAPTPTHNANVNGSTSVHGSAAAYATPANSTIHPSIAFSTSSIASVPPSTSPSKSTSPATATSPLLTFPSMSGPFTIPTFPTVAPVRNLPPATGVLGPTPKGSGKDKKKDKANDKETKQDTDEENEGEKQEKEKKKEKPKRVRKKSEAASAPAAPMSPAARAKAAAILERHRQAIAERAANPPARKRAKKADEVKEPTVTVSKAVEETPAVDEDVEKDDEDDKTKKEKRKRKKKKHAEVEQGQEDGEEAAGEDTPAKTAREESPKSAQEESPSKEKKEKKRKDKERSSPVRASVASGSLAAVEDDGAVVVDLEDAVFGPPKVPIAGDESKGNLKPAVASKAKLVPVITRPADSSTILNAKKGDKTAAVSPAVPKPLTGQTKQIPSTSSAKQAVSISSAKSPPPSVPKVADTENNPPSATSNASKKPSPLCPICLAPFHLRFQCPLLQDRGPVMFRRLAELERTGHAKLVDELRKWLDTETKRDQLRALGKVGAIGKNAQGARAGVLSDGDEYEAQGDLKKRLMSFESEERDEPEEDEEKEVESDVLGDLDDNEEEEEDDDDDAREDSVPASLGRPTTSKPSLVSVQKPGEGSETTSSDSEEDDDMEPIVRNEDDDEEMQDASRAATPHHPSAKLGDDRETSSSSVSSSTRSDSPSPPDKRKANTSQNKSGKPPSTAHSSHTFRDINHETEGQVTDAVHQRDTAKVLVPNSDDSGDEEMIEAGENDGSDEEEEANEDEAEGPHTPNGNVPEHRLSMDSLMQRCESPVAKGRTPGTPSRILVMKDRHGNTAPVQRSYGGEGMDGDEISSPGAYPFPNHKLQSASQLSTLSSRMHRLSDLSNSSFASIRNAASNMFKGTSASSPTGQGLPTPITVPPSGTVLKRDIAKDFLDESTSSSSTESDSDADRGPSRVPRGQRARAIQPKKSMLEHM